MCHLQAYVFRMCIFAQSSFAPVFLLFRLSKKMTEYLFSGVFSDNLIFLTDDFYRIKF